MIRSPWHLNILLDILLQTLTIELFDLYIHVLDFLDLIYLAVIWPSYWLLSDLSSKSS